MKSHGIFTLGGALSTIWHPAHRLLPWALTSALLMAAGMWDFWTRSGPIEWVIVGLSCYELMLGLLEQSDVSQEAPTRSAPAKERADPAFSGRSPLRMRPGHTA